jgi:hypothetical protein
MNHEDVRALTYSQCRSRLGSIYARMAQFGAKHRLSRADEAEFDRLTDEVTAIDERRRSLERADDIARGRSGGYRLEGEGSGIIATADSKIRGICRKSACSRVTRARLRPNYAPAP